MQAFVDRHGLTFPQINDQDGSIFAHFGIPAQPAWIFVDRSGASSGGPGELSPKELDAALSKLES
jgi:hypothetical protein